MKQLVAMIALLVLTKPVIPVLDYILNYDYIANTLCENKAKPQLHCNGKCHLKKELARAASDDHKAAQDKKSSLADAEFILPSLSGAPLCIVSSPEREEHSACHCFYKGGSKPDVFHPPLVIC